MMLMTIMDQKKVSNDWTFNYNPDNEFHIAVKEAFEEVMPLGVVYVTGVYENPEIIVNSELCDCLMMAVIHGVVDELYGYEDYGWRTIKTPLHYRVFEFYQPSYDEDRIPF